MIYELYYWPMIQGRGEFVRLALEDAGVDYVDVARRSERSGMGIPAMMRLMDALQTDHPAFAPPFLRDGRLLIAQTANILLHLGRRHGLAPRAEAGRLWVHQCQLTIADLVAEVHDTHHPLSTNLYYEDQKPAAKRRAHDFARRRIPKYLGYFEGILARAEAEWLGGASCSYADLSLFQVVEGLRFAFPRTMASLAAGHPRILDLHDRVAQRPNLRRYLRSKRRIPFNNDGIFRAYPELDPGPA